MIDARTPFRSIGDIEPLVFARVLADAGSPIPAAERGECWTACEGYSALALAQMKRESSFGKDATAQAKRNPLGLMARDGSTLLTFASWSMALAEWRWRITDPGYKTKPSPYYPSQAAGFLAGYDLSLLGFLKIYVGGPGCLTIKDGVCGNGETFRESAGLAGLRPPPASPSINWYAQEVIRDLNAWLTTTPAPGPEPEPNPGGIVLGRVPRPAGFQLRIIENNTAWNDLGPRQPRGIVLHRMLGTLNGTDSYFRGEARTRALTDFGVGRGDYGPVYQWNRLDGRRAPWASGPADGVKGDGVAFVNRYGVNAINRDCASIEIEGLRYEDPVPATTWDALVQLVAWLADSWLRADYQTWPRNRDGIHALLGHFEFTGQKPCPGSAVLARVPELIEGVRDVLRRYQTGG